MIVTKDERMAINSLKWRIIISITGIVALSLAITTLFIQQRAKNELSNEIQNHAYSLLESTKNHVESQHKSILYHKSVMLERRKTELKNNTIIAFAMIERLYQEFKTGQISEAKAKEHVLLYFKELRYDDGIGYFWINDTASPLPKLILHPTAPELEGSSLDEPQYEHVLGVKGNILKAFVDATQENGEGYVDYLWFKPFAPNTEKYQPKISFVKKFEPWSWIIGTGVYIDDIEKDVQDRIDAVIKDLNSSLGNQNIGENGYFYIINENNDMLVHPNIAGTNTSDVINPITKKMLAEEIKEAAFTKSHSWEYFWDKPGHEGEYIFPKKAYVTFYKPLGWYISSSVYIKDLEHKISRMTNTIIVFFCFFSAISILIALLISKSISNPLNTLIKTISKTDKDGIPIDINNIPKTGTSEIKVLSDTISSMLTSISKSRNEIMVERDFSLDIIDGAPYIICGLDPDGITTFINPTGERVTGYSKEEIIGKSWWDIFYVGDQYKQVETLYENLLNGDIAEYEMVMTSKSGECKSIVWNSLTKRDNKNEIITVIGFGNDITDKKKAEVELQLKSNELFMANKELTLHKEHLLELVDERTKELNKSLNNLKLTQDYLVQTEKMAALGGLVAGVAHEINTPVGVGVTAASYLKDKSNEFLEKQKLGEIVDQDYEKYAGLIIESSGIILANMERAAALIHSFKQVAVDQSCEELRRFTIKQYIDGILLSMHSKFKNTPYEIVVNCPDELSINSYPGALSQIMTNLLMNSLIHGFKEYNEGTITIDVHKTDENVSIIYQDSGHGISKENLNHIYEPFFTTDRAQGGSGLGLQIVYNLVTQTLKGKIQCSSTIGKGTKFELEFPNDLGGLDTD